MTTDPTPNKLPEDLLDHIQQEAQQAFEKGSHRNNMFGIGTLVLAIAMLVLWGFLFWTAESVKYQLLFGLLAVAELIGMGICALMYLADANLLELRKEHRRIELHLLDLHERVVAMQEKRAE